MYKADSFFIRHYIITVYILVAHNACFHSGRLHIILSCLCSDCLAFKHDVVLSEITFSSSRWDFIWNLHDLRSFCERLHRPCGSTFYEFTYACGRVFLSFFQRLFIYFWFFIDHCWHSWDSNQNTIFKHCEIYWVRASQKTQRSTDRKWTWKYCFSVYSEIYSDSMTNRTSW